MSDKICYRKIKNYKYQTKGDYSFSVGIEPKEKIDTLFIVLDTDGKLTIKRLYAWDGPSGPTVDTPNFMRGSLVHDALYQLLRGGYFDENHEETRKKADRLLQEMCLEDGMSKFRAWYVYLGVHWFAKKAAKPTSKPPEEWVCVP